MVARLANAGYVQRGISVCAGWIWQHVSRCCTLAMGWPAPGPAVGACRPGRRCAGRGGRAGVWAGWLPPCRAGRACEWLDQMTWQSQMPARREQDALSGFRTGPTWHRDAPVTAGCHGRRMSSPRQHCGARRPSTGTGPSRLTTCPASHMLVAALCSGAVRQWSGSPRGGLTAGRGWPCWPGLSRTPWLSFVGHAAHGTVQQPNPCPYPESTNT